MTDYKCKSKDMNKLIKAQQEIIELSFRVSKQREELAKLREENKQLLENFIALQKEYTNKTPFGI